MLNKQSNTNYTFADIETLLILLAITTHKIVKRNINQFFSSAFWIKSYSEKTREVMGEKPLSWIIRCFSKRSATWIHRERQATAIAVPASSQVFTSRAGLTKFEICHKFQVDICLVTNHANIYPCKGTHFLKLSKIM